MITKWLVLANVGYVLIKIVEAQYYGSPYYPNMPPPAPYYPPNPPMPARREESFEYEDEPRTGRRRSKLYNSGGKLPSYDDSDEYEDDGGYNDVGKVPPPPAGGQPNLVLVPYPYALVMPNATTNSNPTQSPATTTSTTTTTTTSSTTDVNKQFLIRQGRMTPDNKYMITAVRKTKPTWMPKYGIVPIPDTLAEKLMSQLREVKGYQKY